MPTWRYYVIVSVLKTKEKIFCFFQERLENEALQDSGLFLIWLFQTKNFLSVKFTVANIRVQDSRNFLLLHFPFTERSLQKRLYGILPTKGDSRTRITKRRRFSISCRGCIYFLCENYDTFSFARLSHKPQIKSLSILKLSEWPKFVRILYFSYLKEKKRKFCNTF